MEPELGGPYIDLNDDAVSKSLEFNVGDNGGVDDDVENGSEDAERRVGEVDEYSSMDGDDEVESSDNVVDISEDMNNMEEDVIQQPNEAEEEDSDVVEPAVGMCFPSGDELVKYCTDYALKKGFELFTRNRKLAPEYREKGVSRKGVGEEEAKPYMLVNIRLQCKKGGADQSKGSTVTGCPMYLYARVKDGKMEITKCMLDHNHPLAPEARRFMVNYRGIDDLTFERAAVNDDAGVSITKNFNTFVHENGGPQNLTYNKIDFRNAMNLKRKRSRFKGDGRAFDEYLREQHERNPGFFSRIEKDEEGRLLRAFWADPRGRAMYKDYGNIVTFDTTFQTNRFQMPFARFVGVNQHGKSIVFCAALISGEDADTFVWVFQQFLICMDGKLPRGILTDQCKAIGKAVPLVFPRVAHRLCLWHILQNGMKNLGSNSRWKEIDVAMQGAVHDFLEPEEFDCAWKLVMEKFGLEENKWMKETFENRERWAPGYWRSTFWGGMSSTQRSEGINRFFKTFVHINMGLAVFVRQYEAGMREKAEEERKMNYDSIHRHLRYRKNKIVESVYSKAYTNEKFKEVLEQCEGKSDVHVVKINCLGSVKFYKAWEKIEVPLWRNGWRDYDVSVDKEKGDFKCGCKLFEFRGIICRHLIRAMEVEDVDGIPEKYILCRWRKDVSREYESIPMSYYNPEENEVYTRSRDLAQRHAYLAKLAHQSKEAYQVYQEAIDSVRKTMEDLLRIRNSSWSWADSCRSSVYGRRRLRSKENNERHLKHVAAADVDEEALKDPPVKVSTGRGPKSRTPHPSEKGSAAKKRRKTTPEEFVRNQAVLRATFGGMQGSGSNVGNQRLSDNGETGDGVSAGGGSNAVCRSDGEYNYDDFPGFPLSQESCQLMGNEQLQRWL